MKTTGQVLMQHAYTKVSAHAEAGKTDKEKYGIWCHQLPQLIRSSGLPAALAFLVSKSDEKGFFWLLEDLEKVPGLHDSGLIVKNGSSWQVNGEVDSVQCMIATRRVLQALPFFKRFCESILDVKPGTEAEDQ